MVNAERLSYRAKAKVKRLFAWGSVVAGSDLFPHVTYTVVGSSESARDGSQLDYSKDKGAVIVIVVVALKLRADLHLGAARVELALSSRFIRMGLVSSTLAMSVGYEKC